MPECRCAVFQHVGAFVAEYEFQLTELTGLKPGRFIEPVAEAVERHRRERFDNIDLLHRHLHDGANALEGADGG